MDLPVGTHDPVLAVELATGLDGRHHGRPHRLTIVRVDQPQMRLEGAVEVERVDPVDPVELGAPLHRPRSQVPQPAPDVRQRLALLHAGVDLRQGGLRQVLFGDVARDHHRADWEFLGVEDRAEGQGDRQRHPVGPEDLGLEVPDAVSRQHGGDDPPYLVGQVLGKEQVERAVEHVLGPGAEQPLGGGAPAGDPSLGVTGDDGVVGHLDDRPEQRVRRHGAGRVIRASRCQLSPLTLPVLVHHFMEAAYAASNLGAQRRGPQRCGYARFRKGTPCMSSPFATPFSARP